MGGDVATALVGLAGVAVGQLFGLVRDARRDRSAGLARQLEQLRGAVAEVDEKADTLLDRVAGLEGLVSGYMQLRPIGGRRG